MTQFKNIFLILLLSLHVLGAGTYIKGPALVEGFTTTATAAGTTTLTVASETKQIFTGATTQTVVMPDATTLPLGRKFLIINKSTGVVTVNASGGGLLGTIVAGAQAEVHLRVAGSAAGTWDLLSSSAGGGGTWGSITGTLSSQTDLQSALDLKAPLASPTFSGTVTTPLTASRLLTTGASSELTASAATATEAGYLSGVTGGIQTQLDAKQLRSTLTTKGDLYVATASATTARQGVGSDGQILAADSTKTNGIKWIDPVNADNLIFDGDAEAGITNFVEGSYSAATRPSGTFTPSSGAGTFEISTSSSSPLFGTNSFLLTKSSGASRQGRAIERTINLDSGYQTKMLKTRIDYTIVSGTFVAGSNGSSPTDSSLIWYVGQYNGSTWTYTEPSTFKMFSNSTNKDWVEGEFQVNADTTQLKLIGFISESANSAWVVKAEVGFRLSAYLAGTPITDWVAYTPVGTWSTNTTWTGFWRRVGQDMEVKFQAATSGAPSGNFTANIPSGYTIDTTKLLSTGTQEEIGFGRINDSGSALYHFSLRYNSTVSIIGINLGASGTYVNEPSVVDGTTPIAFGASDIVNGYFKVPITGWSSSTQQSDGYDGREISAHLALASNVTPAANGILIYDTKVYDKTNSFSTSTGVYTVPSSGRYRLSIFSVSTAASGNLIVYKNGSIHKYIGTIMGASKGFSGSTTVDCVAGDTLSINSDSNITYSGGVTYNYLTIEKLQSPTTISATEKVTFMAEGASSTAVGSNTVIPFNTPTEDSHGGWNSTNKDWAAPEPGTYKVNCQARVTSGGATVNQYLDVIIQVDTVSKREFVKYIENTGVAGWEAGTSWQGPLTSGQKIRCVADTNIGSPTLTTGATHTFLEIFRIK